MSPFGHVPLQGEPMPPQASVPPLPPIELVPPLPPEPVVAALVDVVALVALDALLLLLPGVPELVPSSSSASEPQA